MHKLQIAIACIAALTLAACNKETRSGVQAPGAPESAKTKVLEAGAAALQNKPPIEAINAYLDGFHFYNSHQKIQMEKLFKGLPENEKALWHSHVHEVKSGQLIAPGIPELAEKALMKKLIHTYGKTWHTWHTDLDKTLPLGVPQLMMGFTADGQADPAMVAARDKRFNVNSAQQKKDREDIPAPTIDSGADGWQHGKTIQINDPTGSQHAHEEATAGSTQETPDANAHSNKQISNN
ncbi:MAG: DUF1264 domain-containing protein [Cytophagaceae bacterium]|nr:MAG: DUF1264 domain-containing protein [Cytophagaceae bacterium]